MQRLSICLVWAACSSSGDWVPAPPPQKSATINWKWPQDAVAPGCQMNRFVMANATGVAEGTETLAVRCGCNAGACRWSRMFADAPRFAIATRDANVAMVESRSRSKEIIVTLVDMHGVPQSVRRLPLRFDDEPGVEIRAVWAQSQRLFVMARSQARRAQFSLTIIGGRIVESIGHDWVDDRFVAYHRQTSLAQGVIPTDPTLPTEKAIRRHRVSQTSSTTRQAVWFATKQPSFVVRPSHARWHAYNWSDDGQSPMGHDGAVWIDERAAYLLRYVPDGSAMVMAFDHRTGSLLWLTQNVLPAVGAATLRGADGKVYVFGRDSTSWHTWSLSADTGRPIAKRSVARP